MGQMIEVLGPIPDSELSCVDSPIEVNDFWDIPENRVIAAQAITLGLPQTLRARYGVLERKGHPFWLHDDHYDMRCTDGNYARLVQYKIGGVIFWAPYWGPTHYGQNGAARSYESVKAGDYTLLMIRDPLEQVQEIAAWSGSTARLARAELIGTESESPYPTGSKDPRTLQLIDPVTDQFIIRNWNLENQEYSIYSYLPIIGIKTEGIPQI